jgi:peroxiredoxin
MRLLVYVMAIVLACGLAVPAAAIEPFPDFTLKDLHGRAVSLSQFRGKVVILNLWMTTCPPCKKEMPMLQQLQKKYANQGVVVVGISADEKANTAASFARTLGVTYPLLIHPALMISESEQQKFGLLGLPTTYILDKTGSVRKKVIGFLDKEDIEQALEEVLSNP